MKQLVLVTVSGPDKPGITSTLMKIIVRDEKKIEDMGQSVTHGLLSLSILIDIGADNSHDAPLLKDLLFAAKSMGMELEFQVLEDEKKVKKPDLNERFILSCVAIEGLTAEFVAEIAQTLASNKINISRIDNISDEGFRSVDFTTNTTQKKTDWDKLKSDLLAVSDKHNVDLAFLKDNVFRRNKRLIVFDMDSTLIQTEVIDEMAKLHGIGEKVKDITERAMNGELDYTQSLKERVSLLKGFDTNQMKSIADNLPITPGVEEFVKTTKALGYKLAVISGGFQFFANHLKNKLGLDYAFANDLEVDGSELTGKIKGNIVDPSQKAFLLDMITQQEGIHLEQVVAIGDGANDLAMLSKAGLGIAFHAKELVRKKAGNQMSHGPMTSILYFLGIPEAQKYLS
jgi:phosphoserine phosphatase